MLFLLMQHGHHLSWPPEVLIVAVIAFRLFIRRGGPRGGPFGR